MTDDKNDSQSSREAQGWPIRARLPRPSKVLLSGSFISVPIAKLYGYGTNSFYWIPRKGGGGAVRFSELPRAGEETRQARPHPSSVYAERRVI